MIRGGILDQANSALGTSQEVPDPGAGGTSGAKTLLMLAAKAQGNPEVVTVTIGAAIKSGKMANGIYAITGHATWGTGFSTQSLDFDVSTGCKLTLPASNLNISVQVVNGGLADPGLVFEFTASVAYGPTGKGLPLIATSARVNIADGATFAFGVPDYAREVSILASDPASCEVILGNAFRFYWSNAVAANGNAKIPLPLPLYHSGGLYPGPTLVIKNTTGGGAGIFFAPIFFLDF